jgi:hypothetical protein
MGLLSIFGHKRESPNAVTSDDDACPHLALVPRWDSVNDMGKPEKITSYICDGCHAPFSREEGERSRAEGIEHLRQERDEMERRAA